MDNLIPDEIKELARISDLFTKRSYNLNILKEGQLYPAVTSAIENHFKNSERRKELLLPELTYKNETIAIFSDYGGESQDSDYLTYSFLICAWQHTGTFQQIMSEIRSKHKLGNKEISFKDFSYGPISRALDDYLAALDTVTGLLFTMLAEKNVFALSSRDRIESEHMATELRKQGLGSWKGSVVEKLLRICHISAYLVSLLSMEGQKIYWLTDHDSIAPNEDLAKHWLKIFNNLLNHYSHHSFSLVGGSVPFEEKEIRLLDLLSATDICAGSIEHYFTRMSKGIEDVKVEADKVIQWLGYDGLMLKKHHIIAKAAENGGANIGSLRFKLRDPDNTKIRINIVRP